MTPRFRGDNFLGEQAHPFLPSAAQLEFAQGHLGARTVKRKKRPALRRTTFTNKDYDIVAFP